MGLAHRLLATCSLPLYDDDGTLLAVVQQAALVLNSLCWAGEARHVQMLVACQAIPVLVQLLAAQVFLHKSRERLDPMSNFQGIRPSRYVISTHTRITHFLSERKHL